MSIRRQTRLACVLLLPSAALVAACMWGPPGLARTAALAALSLAGLMLTAFAAVLASEGAAHWRLVRDLLRDGTPTTTRAGFEVHLIDGSGGPFVAGIIRPRIYLPSAALSRLPASELQAVLAHEAWHQRGHAPARLLLLTTLGRCLGWVPWVRAEVEIARAMMEVEADRNALRLGARRSTLASALLRVRNEWPASPVAAFERHGALRLRVLLGDMEAVPRTAGFRWAVAAVAATLACLAFYLR